MSIQDTIAKTGLILIGLCQGIKEYKAKSGTVYYSTDFLVNGCTNAVNVKLPEGFDRSKLLLWELTKLPIAIQPTFDRKGIELVAVV